MLHKVFHTPLNYIFLLAKHVLFSGSMTECSEHWQWSCHPGKQFIFGPQLESPLNNEHLSDTAFPTLNN